MENKLESIKNKVKFVSRILKMQTVLRDQREDLIKIKQYNQGKIPKGLLLEGESAIKSFLLMKKRDSVNEARPY